MPSGGRRILADVNVWLATLVERHPHHDAAVAWWRGEVVPSRPTVCFCRVTQLGLLRLLTNEAVMGRSRRSPQQAWRDFDQLLEQPVVGFLDEPEGLGDLLRQQTIGRDTSASLWTDAYLASFARASDLELVTFDRGFRRFSNVTVRILA